MVESSWQPDGALTHVKEEEEEEDEEDGGDDHILAPRIRTASGQTPGRKIFYFASISLPVCLLILWI